MKADTVTIEERIYYEEAELVPKTKLTQYVSTDKDSTVYYRISIHKITANVTDQAIEISENANTKETWLWDTAGSPASDLTVKTNGDTDGRGCKPLRVLSGPLSSLSVSNSDAVNPKYLGIVRIIVSDTTNTELKEIDND